MIRWDTDHLAKQAALRLPGRRGLRLLHVTDFHNRVDGFRFAIGLAVRLEPDVVVNTGDISGVGGPVEWLLVRGLVSIQVPHVFAPGNHDTVRTEDRIARSATVLDGSIVRGVANLDFLGFRDPNRTRLAIGPAYDPELAARSAARVDLLGTASDRAVVAVHNELMAGAARPQMPVVLSGHYHRARVRLEDETLFVRSGSIGGGGPFGGPLEASVVDVEQGNHTPNSVFFIRATATEVDVRRAF